ncbi:hypothetical protein [Blastococcus sp. TF02A-26]|uniref:hypothetical protein n=1 Tax=Blastococcus sp. TF02A-26 TaxID=2250577 RepID=UPI0011BEE44A|nr:hypothetical protein [Blastococcus sp. TF02A-26]
MSSNKENRSYRRGGDKSRRGRWLDAVVSSGVSRGAVAWAVALAKRSNAMAKPVWGLQTGQAEEIGCSDRQVRRYRAELERAGLIRTVRAPFERRAGGVIGRMFTNVYQFVVEPLERRKRRSDRPDIDVRSNPSVPNGTVQTSSGNVLILDPGFTDDDFAPGSPFRSRLSSEGDSDSATIESPPSPIASIAMARRALR